VIRAGRTGIGLHGAGTNTRIEGNEIYGCNTEGGKNTAIWGGIVIRNVNYANTTFGQHGPTFHNSVVSNHLQGANCDLKAFSLNYSRYADLFHAIGNSQALNTFADSAKLVWNDQLP
jgi:hypothetical protein